MSGNKIEANSFLIQYISVSSHYWHWFWRLFLSSSCVVSSLALNYLYWKASETGGIQYIPPLTHAGFRTVNAWSNKCRSSYRIGARSIVRSSDLSWDSIALSLKHSLSLYNTRNQYLYFKEIKGDNFVFENNDNFQRYILLLHGGLIIVIVNYTQPYTRNGIRRV